MGEMCRFRPPGVHLLCSADWRPPKLPKGPKIEKNQDRPPGSKISSEIENVKRAAHETPIFVGYSEGQD